MSYRKNYREYNLIVPDSLGSALEMLKAEPGRWRPFAGGTDIMVVLDAGKLDHREFISVSLPELKSIEVTERQVRIGAAVNYSAIQRHGILRAEFPALCRAASWTGSVAIQNRGTLGGNIANASPAGDSLPVLLACDADIELASSQGTRVVAYGEFHTGYKKTVMRGDELISAVLLPRRDWVQWTRKVGTRKAQAISKVCIAAGIKMNGNILEDCRVAFASVAEIPFRARKTEDLLRGKSLDESALISARATLENEIQPIDDIRSTAEYRRRVAGNLLVEFLEHVSGIVGDANSRHQ